MLKKVLYVVWSIGEDVIDQIVSAVEKATGYDRYAVRTRAKYERQNIEEWE